MIRRSLHTSIPRLQTSDNASLSFPSKKVHDYFFANDKNNMYPPSFKTKYFANQYKSPLKIDETFQACNEYLSEKSSAKKTTTETGSVVQNIYNPVTRYNFQYHNRIENNPMIIDYNLPVYRKLNFDHWRESMDGKGLMLLMQRLESLKIIPDTLPTLKEPKYQLHLRFPFVNGINRWVEPGLQLSSNATSFPPQFKVINMISELPTTELLKKKFTILIVNPDEPCLETDSFKTVLHYGLSDITFTDLNNNLVSEFIEDGTTTFKKLVNYLPPVPEKNSGLQRFAVWLFEQKDGESLKATTIDGTSSSRFEHFDIREFVLENELTPVGASVWRSAFDSNVPAIREQYHLPKGRVFHKIRA